MRHSSVRSPRLRRFGERLARFCDPDAVRAVTTDAMRVAQKCAAWFSCRQRQRWAFPSRSSADARKLG
jgi:hypothetical protein